MKKIILASNNNHKVREIKNMLSELDIDVVSLRDENIDIEVIEDGNTFEENSKKKAKEIVDYLNSRGEKNFIVLADDSGLEVDYLNGAPGIYSARYAGDHGNDNMNNEKLLRELKGVEKKDRRARFVCHLSLIDNNYNYLGIRGQVEGIILNEIEGEGGFGYDPLFYYEPANKSFGLMTEEEKNKVSHRARALKELKEKIKEFI